MRKFMGLLSFLLGFGSNAQVFQDTTNFQILDVRTPEEFSASHVEGAQNIDFLNSSFQTKIQNLDKNKIYKVYCRSGNRSGQAEKLMKSLGFKDVENLGSLSTASKRLQKNCVGKNKNC